MSIWAHQALGAVRAGGFAEEGVCVACSIIWPTTPPVSPPSPAVPDLLFPKGCTLLCLEPVCGGGPCSLGARRPLSRGGVLRLTPFPL